MVNHHRKSIRLQGYDYSQQGAYFVTICTQNRECLFGKIVDGEMVLYDAGRMIDIWWTKLFEKFQDISMNAYVIMPNHIHGIITIDNVIINPIVGAIPRNRPNLDLPGVKSTMNVNIESLRKEEHMMDILIENTGKNATYKKGGTQINIKGENVMDKKGDYMESPLRVYNTYDGLGRYLSWFKRMSTNEYIRNVKQKNWQPFEGRLWQRNYHEHIIRDEKDMNRIQEYIINNPKNWEKDTLYS